MHPALPRKRGRIASVAIAIVMLTLIYVFQRLSLAYLLPGANVKSWHPNALFIFDRTVRLILNDLACFLLIFGLFDSRRHLKVAFYLFLIELLVILPLYFAIKLSIEGATEISSPILSQIHRLIVNPMLMLLLICGFYLQRYSTPKK